MPRHWHKLLFWGGCAFLAVWILWWASSGYPLDGPICPSENTRDDCPRYDVLSYSAWQIAKFADHWSVLITAAATVAIAWLTITLARVGRQQIGDTRILQRAYISVEPGGIRPFEGENESRIACDVIIHNAGNLPAHDLRWGLQIKYSNSDKEDFDGSKVTLLGEIVVTPKGRIRKGTDPTNQMTFD